MHHLGRYPQLKPQNVPNVSFSLSSSGLALTTLVGVEITWATLRGLGADGWRLGRGAAGGDNGLSGAEAGGDL